MRPTALLLLLLLLARKNDGTLLLHARKTNGSVTQRCLGDTITTRTSHL